LHVVTVSKFARADDEFTDAGVRFHYLRLPPLPRAALAYQIDRRRIAARLRRIAPDVVEGFGTESSFGYAAVSSGFPSVLMIQGIVAKLIRAEGWRALTRPALAVPLFFERLTVARCHHAICETTFAARFVRSINPRAVVHELSTPVDDRFFDVARAVIPSSVLFVGWVGFAKGIDVLLTAFARVVEAVPDATLDVVGPYEPSYLSGELSRLTPAVRDRVRLHGWQPPAAVAAHLSRTALLVLPTRMDTAPNVIAEARAAGVPVIASAVGGIPELIADGCDGLLVPPGQPAALGEAIIGVLRDSAAARALAEAGRCRAERDHRLGTQVARRLAIYRDVAGVA
jgi:glycosyltransferase involved in cell wall biosynthesis